MGNPIKDLASVVKPVRSISPASLTATATGEWVDTKGFGSVMLMLSLGAMTTVDADTNYFTPSIEDADESDKSDAATLNAANYEAVLGGSFIAKVNASGLANTFRTWQYSFQLRDFSRTVKLPKQPYKSITTLEYYDGVTYAWVAMTASQYKVLGMGDQGELMLLEYPGSIFRVTYQAGYGASSSYVPADLRAAIMRRVATMYENRQDVIVGTIFAKMDKDQSVESLEAPYRVAVI